MTVTAAPTADIQPESAAWVAAQLRPQAITVDWLRNQLDTETRHRDRMIRTAANGGLRMSAIADMLGMSRQRVSQIVSDDATEAAA